MKLFFLIIFILFYFIVNAARIMEIVEKETCYFRFVNICTHDLNLAMTLQHNRAQEKFQLELTLGYILWEEEG